MFAVALHVRAWVEIAAPTITTYPGEVALHVRAWVEIKIFLTTRKKYLSPSM